MSRVCVACGNTENVGRFCPVCGASQPEQPAGGNDDRLIGTVISDRYEVVSLLNEGGMGRVYKGLHHALDREVAIKVVHQHLLTSEEVISRFLAEARTVSRLQHPNVVSIFDFGRTAASDGRRPYIVMELLSGPDMSTLTDSGEPIAPGRVTSLLTQVLAALADAHLLGITHRDIKPENIIIERTRLGAEHVKVIDFGIARVETDRRVTQANMLVGTPYYMAPEQVTQRAAGPAVDLYAVGVMLFQLLTGQLPFDGATPAEILRVAMNPVRPDPRKVAPTRAISDALADVCMKALALDPADRYPDAASFAEALEEAGTTFNTGRFRAVQAPMPMRPSTALPSVPPPPPSASVAGPKASPGASPLRSTGATTMTTTPVGSVAPARPAATPVTTASPASAPQRGPGEKPSATSVSQSSLHATARGGAAARESIPPLSLPPASFPPEELVSMTPVIPAAPRVPSVTSMPASSGPVVGGSAAARPPGTLSSMGLASVRPPPPAQPTAPASPPSASSPAASGNVGTGFEAPTHRSQQLAIPSAPSTPMGTTPGGAPRPMVQPGRPRTGARSFIMVGEMPLMGRSEDLAFCETLARDPGDARGFALRGRHGVGRTRLLRDVGLRVASQGIRFIAAPSRRAPGNEIGYGWLRRAIAALLDLAPTDGSLAAGRVMGPPEAVAGVRTIFSESNTAPTPEATRASVTGALRWAAEWAVSRAPGGRVLLGIDDADHLSSADRAALAELLISPKIQGFAVATTSLRPTKLPSLREHELVGFSQQDLNELGRTSGEMPAWPPSAVELEPLYVDLARRWAEGLKRTEQPATLRELVAWRMSLLVSVRRALLAAVALTGGDTGPMLAQIAGVEGDFDTPLRALVDAGFLEPRGEELVLRHGIFSELALEGMPDDVRIAMHRRAARSLSQRNQWPELQAYHAIRSGADFDAYIKIDASARLRASRGDDEGAIMALAEGFRVARATAMRHGDDEASIDAWTTFARKLGDALVRAGRHDEALSVLTDARSNQQASDNSRALLLEQLSRVQTLRGRHEEAARLRSEALALAERRGDPALIARLRGSDPPPDASGPGVRTRRRSTY